MNLHIAQSQGARIECSTICRTAFQLISGQNSAPVMGCVQNTLMCMYIITETFTTPEKPGDLPTRTFPDGTPGYETMVDLEDFMSAIQSAKISNERLHDLAKRASVHPDYKKFVVHQGESLKFTKQVPGKLVASIVFPRTFTWTRKTEVNERLPIVSITKGIIDFNSGPLCKKSIGGVRDSALHPLWKISPDTGATTISEFQFMTSVLIKYYSCSMGISDCIPTSAEEVKKSIDEAMIKCEMINSSNKDAADKEREINGALNEVMSIAPRLAKTSMTKLDRNSLVIMKKSGAKGSDTNNGQISWLVGQQNIDGKRMPCMLSNGTRTLPHFFPGDNSPAARGFVSNSYLQGLTVQETWFHAAGGRRGVVDTALKTSDSGYVQKKIVKKTEDAKVRHDGTVRDSNGFIVQFMYGGDGFNAKELVSAKNLDSPFFANPFQIASTLNAEAEYRRDEQKSDIGKFRGLTREDADLLVSFIQAGCPGVQTEVTERATYNIKTAIRASLVGVKLYESVIPDFIRKILDEYEEAKAKMGYMAGLIAASAIGEPTTQMSQTKDDRIPIMIRYKSGKIRYYNGRIGHLVDEILEKCCNVVTTHGKSTVGIPAIEIYVNTVDPVTSKCEWKNLQEVSRHPANGGMVKVTTKSGRITTTTLSHSHLKRATDGTIVPIRGDELEVGHFVPVCGKLNTHEDLLINEITVEGKVFPLDFEVGWIFGAYLSEGHVNGGQIGITNVSKHFEKRCILFAKTFGGEVRKTEKKGSIYGSKKKYLGITNYISGLTGFGRYLGETCGKGSANKHVPAFALFAPEKFVSGLIRGYFDGDGNVNESRQLIRVSSISRDLIETVALLLSRFGIFGTISIETKANREQNEQPLISYIILRKYARTFMEKIGTDFPEKLKAIKKIVEYNERENVHSRREDIDVVPGIGINVSKAARPLGLPGYSRNYKRHETKPFLGKETLRKYVELFEENGATGRHMDILRTALDADIVWDQIVSLEILEDPKTMVYDLGVTGNHTFMMQSGILTHNTLNTFHSAGMSAKDVTLGVPRLKELLNATKNPSKPTCTVFLTDTILKKNFEDRQNLKELIKSGDADAIAKRDALDLEGLKRATKLSNAFTELTIGHFIDSHELQYLPTDEYGEPREHTPIGLLDYDQYDPEWWVNAANKLKGKPKFPPESWVVILKLNKDKLFRYNITPSDIGKIIENVVGTHSYVMACVASPATIGQIEVYLNFSEIGEYVHETADLPEKGSSSRILTHENLDYFAVREIAIPLIKKVAVQGIKGIEKTYVHQDGLTGEWIVDTQGTNIMDILSLPGVDTTRTLSDDVWEMFHAIGIEGAGYFLKKEITRILSFDGTYINPRHISLLVDVMLRTGVITSANRDGIGRDVGPLAKGMFEKAVENIAESSAFAEHDIMKGVSAAIMFGALPEVGTGTVNIKDAEKLPARSRKPIEVPLAPKSSLEKKTVAKK